MTSELLISKICTVPSPSIVRHGRCGVNMWAYPRERKFAKLQCMSVTTWLWGGWEDARCRGRQSCSNYFKSFLSDVFHVFFIILFYFFYSFHMHGCSFRTCMGCFLDPFTFICRISQCVSERSLTLMAGGTMTKEIKWRSPISGLGSLGGGENS